MMILNMRKLAAVLSFAFLAMFAASCAQPTGPAASGTKSFGAGDSHAAFDIATPNLAGSATGTTINLSWSNGGTTGGESAGGEFWGSTQASLREGSGHTDVHIWNAETSTWDKLGESVTGTYQLTGMTDGTYTFMVKEKSLEGFSPNQMTHHSENSNTVNVTISSCVTTFNVSSISHPGWNGSQLKGVNPNYAPSFDGNGFYTAGNWQINVGSVTNNQGKVSLQLKLSATCSATATALTNVTGQVYNGNTAVGTAQLATWDAPSQKYLINNMEYPNNAGTWSIKIKVGTTDVMTPITLVAN
jgi:hypothetical protein